MVLTRNELVVAYEFMRENMGEFTKPQNDLWIKLNKILGPTLSKEEFFKIDSRLTEHDYDIYITTAEEIGNIDALDYVISCTPSLK